MKKTFFLLLSLLLTLAPFTAQAQSKQSKSYQISRAEEYISEYDYEKARECINKELADNPKSAEAYNILGFIHLCNEEYGKSLTALNTALKYYDKKDKEGRALCCYYLALTHAYLNDSTQTVHYYKEAIRYAPDNIGYASELANLYIFFTQYDEAEEIYTQLHKKHPGESFPLFGLSRIAYEREQYDKAKAYVEKAALMGDNDAAVHKMLMRIAMKKEDYQTVLGEAIQVLDADAENNEAYCYLFLMADSLYSNTVNAVKKKCLSNTSMKEYWHYILASIYKEHKEYPKALKALQEVLQGVPAWAEAALKMQIDIYEDMDHHPKVLEHCNKLFATYPNTEDRAEYLCRRGCAEFKLGMLEEARKDFEEVLTLDMGYDYFCYYRLGWIAEVQHDYEQALELYEKCSVLKEDYSYIYMMQGNLLRDYLNRPQEARKCFLKCIEVENGELSQNTCRQYAYIGLGNRTKAIEITDSLLAAFPDEAGTYYDAACVYSRLNEKTTALHYLQTCLEKGYLDIPHILQDNDMDNIRDTKEFKQLLEQYTKLYEAEMAKDSQEDNADEEGLVTHEIPIVGKAGGTYLIRASINGLEMNFILDTGCADISLSSVESDFMLKNGYLKASDLKGVQPYSDANGDVHYSRQVTLQEVCLGDLKLKNIHAGIVPNQQAPLLLGQSVLSKFGKVEIDYKNMVLRIKVKE